MTVRALTRAHSGHIEAVEIGNRLVDAKIITAEQLSICLRQHSMMLAQGENIFIEQILLNNRFCTSAQIDSIIASESTGQSGIYTQILPVDICKRYKVFPLRVTNGVMELKSAIPLNEKMLNVIKHAGVVSVNEVKIIPTDVAEIAKYLANVIDSQYSFEVVLEKMKNTEINGSLLRQAIDALLISAITMRSSDIHIDKKPDPQAWISYRDDGDITHKHLVPAKIMAALFTKLKSDANMDAADEHRAQDGRVYLDANGTRIGFRVATQPIVNGETMTLRALDKSNLVSLDDLFPNQEFMTRLFRGLANVKGKQGGLVLFSGPTGSGKTTSLNALIELFPRDKKNVITVEDPVEYEVAFVRQIQLNQLLAEKSVDVERSLLRQDPDVIVMGEIRDMDTMSAALQFATSGHMVLGSIHADDVTQTLQRVLSFVDGRDSTKALFMLANTLRVVVNQKLIRRLCTCAVEDTDTEVSLTKAGAVHIHVNPSAPLLKKVGCPLCRDTGYKGRVAAHETMVLSINEQHRRDISQKIRDGKFDDLLTTEGVSLRKRTDTLGSLLEASIIDVESAVSLMDQELV